mmetsp:Transcript_3128/g.6506  ORF Transcript_3128/g.6506 Transcript_3128/m.6506 type:complete len:161 (+) Transcript_3128:297-779(+)
MGTSCSLASTECRRCADSDTTAGHGQNSRLVEAARVGDAQAVQNAIRHGAAANAADSHGWTALHYSAAGGHLEVCKVLVDHCSDVNATLPDFSTPLMLAAEEGHLSIAKFLLDNGALPKCKDEDGFTAQDRCDKNIEAELKKLLALPISERYRKLNGAAV